MCVRRLDAFDRHRSLVSSLHSGARQGSRSRVCQWCVVEVVVVTPHFPKGETTHMVRGCRRAMVGDRELYEAWKIDTSASKDVEATPGEELGVWSLICECECFRPRTSALLLDCIIGTSPAKGVDRGTVSGWRWFSAAGIVNEIVVVVVVVCVGRWRCWSVCAGRRYGRCPGKEPEEIRRRW